MCAMGLALGKKVETDCTIYAQFDGAEYCFANEDAKVTFMKDRQGNLAKARAYYKEQGRIASAGCTTLIWCNGVVCEMPCLPGRGVDKLHSVQWRGHVPLAYRCRAGLPVL
jgi:hypothetical protein